MTDTFGSLLPRYRQPCLHRPCCNAVLGLCSRMGLCLAPRDGTIYGTSKVDGMMTHSVMASVWQAWRMRWCCNGCENGVEAVASGSLVPSVRGRAFYVLSSCAFLCMTSCLYACDFVVSTKKPDKTVQFLRFMQCVAPWRLAALCCARSPMHQVWAT
jgi:hypothetical protein